MLWRRRPTLLLAKQLPQLTMLALPLLLQPTRSRQLLLKEPALTICLLLSTSSTVERSQQKQRRLPLLLMPTLLLLAPYLLMIPLPLRKLILLHMRRWLPLRQLLHLLLQPPSRSLLHRMQSRRRVLHLKQLRPPPKPLHRLWLRLLLKLLRLLWLLPRFPVVILLQHMLTSPPKTRPWRPVLQQKLKHLLRHLPLLQPRTLRSSDPPVEFICAVA